MNGGITLSPKKPSWTSSPILRGGALVCIVGVWLVSVWQSGVGLFLINDPVPTLPPPHKVTLVVASQTRDDTSWLKYSFPGWQHLVYVTDEPRAPLIVPANKGREGMVYLTYIIDNYDHFVNLTDIIIFQHADRYQWHNDDPLYDGERVLQRLQLDYVRQEGYVNLRCVWTLGCPVEISPPVEGAPEIDSGWDLQAATAFKDAFAELFPEFEMPTEVGASCCAQFAVTVAKVLERPLSDYERYRQWLLDTPLDDDMSGRIAEYFWHIIFGKPPKFCPQASECYCQVFGLCHLTCEEDGICESQYTLPPYSLMPEGWPDVGWEGEFQNVTELRAQQELDYDPE